MQGECVRRDRLLQRERGEISNCRERQEKDVRRTEGIVNYGGGQWLLRG